MNMGRSDSDVFATTFNLHSWQLVDFAVKCHSIVVQKSVPVPDHELFSKLEKLLVDKIDAKDDDQYIPMAQQAISVLYQLSDNPDVLGGKLCQVLAQKMKNSPKNGLILRRSFFVVGHIAVCQLNHLDCQVFGELKRRNALRELTKEKERVKKTKAKNRRVSAFGTESPRTAR